MSADPIIYCLERLTDYRQFERLASDLMDATDYPGIEPLGGTGDGGRDALHIHRNNDTTTIFAYSVREDWKTKLRADCHRIAEMGHAANTIVFVSTQAINARQKDDMYAEIFERYGWSTEYYDIERMRVLLTGSQKSLVEKHPSIFVWPWFERRGGELVTHEQHDLILIDHLGDDYAFARWLFSRLSAAGYSVWCHGLAPLVGENADASVRALIQKRAACYIPVLSSVSALNQDLRSRITIAIGEVNHVLPCWVDNLCNQDFDSHLATIVPVRFDVSWSTGLASLDQQLDNCGVAKLLEGSSGRRIALSTYQSEPLLRSEPEHIYANVFSVKVPKAILVYELQNEDVELEPVLEQRWAHVHRGQYLFAFTDAPDDLSLVQACPPKYYAWRHYHERYGVKSEDLVKMLVKRSLFVACYSAGFKWCTERYTFYLDEKAQQMHCYQHVDGKSARISFTGERSWGSGEQRSKFNYQLGPVFRVTFDEEGLVWVTVRLYVRITDCEGSPLGVHMIPSRRKHVTRNWWNRQWLQRTLGVMQLLAGKSDINGHIVIGCGTRAVTVNVMPLSWECPVSIDVEALDRVGNFQSELATAREIHEIEDSYPEVNTNE